MKRLFEHDDEQRFVSDLRRLGRALLAIAEAPRRSRLRAKLRRNLARRLLRDNTMLELAVQIALHADDPDQEDYALVSVLHEARLKRLAEESAARSELRREARNRAQQRKRLRSASVPD